MVGDARTGFIGCLIGWKVAGLFVYVERRAILDDPPLVWVDGKSPAAVVAAGVGEVFVGVAGSTLGGVASSTSSCLPLSSMSSSSSESSS